MAAGSVPSACVQRPRTCGATRPSIHPTQPHQRPSVQGTTGRESPRARRRQAVKVVRRGAKPRSPRRRTHGRAPRREDAPRAARRPGTRRTRRRLPCRRLRRLRRRGARDLAPVLEERGAGGAVGHRDELPARDGFVLELVDDQQVGLDARPGAPARRSARRSSLRSAAASRRRPAPRAGTGQRPPGDWGRTSAFAPGTTTIWFSPSSATRISAIPVVPVRSTCQLDTGGVQPGSASSANASRPTAPTIRTRRPEPRCRHRLVRALAAREPLEARARDRLAGAWQDVDPRDQVEVDRPDDGQFDASPQAAMARRSSSARPSRFSRRSNRPAQSEPRSIADCQRTCDDSPSSARTSTASSR